MADDAGCPQKRSYVSPYIFIRAEGGKGLVWDYRRHRQWSVDAEHLCRLVELSGDGAPASSRVDPDLRGAGLITDAPPDEIAWGWDDLSHIFHVGTRDIPITSNPDQSEEEWIEEYLKYCDEIAASQPDLHTVRSGPETPLPDPEPDACAGSLAEALRLRKTCRHFNGGSTDLRTLSNVLFASFGHFHGEWTELCRLGLAETGLRKASPSGGGLHPAEAYLVALRLDGLAPGLYHYRSKDHVLAGLRAGEFEADLIKMLWGQYYAKGIAFGVVITARFDKAWWKYKHSRAYRNILLDVGHVSQTFLLAATSLGLQTWLTGAFADSSLKTFLELASDAEAPMFFVAAGHGDSHSFDPKLVAQIKAHAP